MPSSTSAARGSAPALASSASAAGDRVAVLSANSHRYFEAVLRDPCARHGDRAAQHAARASPSSRDPRATAGARVLSPIAIRDRSPRASSAWCRSPTTTRRCSTRAPAQRRRASRRECAGRAVLHRRHDRRAQGRDAQPPQPGRQRVPQDRRLLARRRRRVPRRAGDVPRRRRRAARRLDLARGDDGDGAGVRPGTLPRRDRAATRSRVFMPVPTMLAALIAAQRASPRDVVVAAHARPRRLADRQRGDRGGARDVSRRRDRAVLRRHRDRFDRHLLPQRARGDRHAAARLVRAIGAGSRGQGRARRRQRMRAGRGRRDPGARAQRHARLLAQSEAATAAALVGGWYHTGDLGLLRRRRLPVRRRPH